MKHFSVGLTIFVVMVCSVLHAAGAQTGVRPLLGPEYPRAFFFRQSEGLASRPGMAYEEWEGSFAGLDGIMGKCLDEEIPGRSERNVEFFSRFKGDHPEKMVLLHFNGNSRDPRFEAEGFFAGHWLYHNGCKVVCDVPAEGGVFTLQVEDASLFSVNIGRFRDKNDDVGMCALDAEGRPDWSQSEQLELVGIDADAQTIEVRRGAFGSGPRAFAAGRAHVAAHVSEGPWGHQANLLWAYNYATCCPRDAEGRSCADVLIGDLCRWFGADGPLAVFDGVEFDVLFGQPIGSGRARGVDVDADGRRDAVVGGAGNPYGEGVHVFLKGLREALGASRLILADGHSPMNQRSVGILNGIESEGWPDLQDSGLSDWSGGLNRHGFWEARAFEPGLSYINHKFNEGGQRVEAPMNITRLVLAAAHLTGSAFTFSQAPPGEEGALVGVWDELWLGVAHRPRWLGRPLGEAVHLGFDGPDLLGGAAGNWEAGEGSVLERAEDGWVLKGEAAAERAEAVLRGVELPPGDLLIGCTIRCEASGAMPGRPRLLWLRCAPAGGMISEELPGASVRFRSGEEMELDSEGHGLLHYLDAAAIDGERHEAYLAHPPYGFEQGPGSLVWERSLTLPDECPHLACFTGLRPAPMASDGVVFGVVLEHEGNAHELLSSYQQGYGWEAHDLDLARWAGEPVTLRFSTDSGPKDDPTADHALWGMWRCSRGAPKRREWDARARG